MDRHRLDAMLFTGTAGAAIAAKAGYPSVKVPAGFVAGVHDKETPDYPYGATFNGSTLSARGSYCERAARGSLGVTSKAKWKAGRFSPGWSCA